MPDTHNWLAFELHILCTASVLYLIWTQTTLSTNNKNAPSEPKPSGSMASASSVSSLQTRPGSPRIQADGNRRFVSPATYPKTDFGYVWMSVPKNYRASRDDGMSTGLLLGPLIAASLLYSSITKVSDIPSLSASILPAGWLIEAPVTLQNSHTHLPAADAALLSRYSLLDLSTFCSSILLFHVCASWWAERRACKESSKPEGERASVPRSEWRRTWCYVLFALGTSVMMVGLKVATGIYDVNLWQYLNLFEVVVASLFYQFTLYIALRLAHGGFTLGELGLVCFGGTSLCLETLNITIARIWPITTPYIRTYRLPTPLLIFQIALIVGSFLVGSLLSPILVLSRNNAQRPVHRLRFPQEKERNRRAYAFGFYTGAFLIVGTLIALWARWCLGNRDPWLWVIFRIVEGKKKWTRPALLGYWALLGSISVAGWNRQLARSRRFRAPRSQTPTIEPAGLNVPATASVMSSSPLMECAAVGVASGIEEPDSHAGVTDAVGTNGAGAAPASVSASTSTTSTTGTVVSASGSTGSVSGSTSTARGMTFPTSFPTMSNLPNLPNLSNLPNGKDMTDLLDAADKHVPTLGLNGRRKFFHGLAVVMFVPGVAVDPAFTHLSFSAAFALFTFAEYVRYFAIYPFGASLHLFMNEFLDHRDSGTAILSHFYLLTGCAGSLWLEGPSQLLQFTGILTLGLGDAMASIVGRRLGVHRWSSTTPKTLEGSLAFAASIFTAAWILRVAGCVEAFSSARYLGAVAISALLEALSDQNDNLTLPLYVWSLLVLADV